MAALAAARPGRGLDPDRVPARARVGAGQREPGPRVRGAADGAGQGAGDRHLPGRATSPRRGPSPGPRVLEHLVDTVLYFEGERHHAYRVLRAVKNRFGSTNEIGVFEMGERRPRPRCRTRRGSSWPSAPRTRRARWSWPASRAPGRSWSRSRPWSRPAGFGTPRRTVLGADYNRVCLLLAVLEKRVGFPLQIPGRLRQRRRRRAGVRARRRSRRWCSRRPRAISTARCGATWWWSARWGWPGRCGR